MQLNAEYGVPFTLDTEHLSRALCAPSLRFGSCMRTASMYRWQCIVAWRSCGTKKVDMGERERVSIGFWEKLDKREMPWVSENILIDVHDSRLCVCETNQPKQERSVWIFCCQTLNDELHTYAKVYLPFRRRNRHHNFLFMDLYSSFCYALSEALNLCADTGTTRH